MYKEYRPCNLLSPYIDRYWEFDGETEGGTKYIIPPHGCADIVFATDNAPDFAARSSELRPHHSYFAGPMNTYKELTSNAESMQILGVRFRPCGLSRFIDLPLHELINQKADVAHLPTLFECSFTETLCKKECTQQRITAIEKYLIKLLMHSGRHRDKQIAMAVCLIEQYKGNISIRDVSSEICLCQRHLERKFRECTGYSPKEYSQIVKFWNAIALLRNHAAFNNLLSVAIEAGYYDVSHLSREVKRLSGDVPYAFLKTKIENEAKVIHLEYPASELI